MPGNLYIPVEATDDGTQRPYPANAPTPPWLGQNLRFTYNGVPDTKAYIGKKNNIVIGVKNKGDQPMDNVTVQAYVFAAGFGFGYPGYAAFRCDVDQPIQTVGAHSMATFVMKEPWEPVDTDGAPDKHYCILANVYQVGGEGKLLDYQDEHAVLDVDHNQHHGQCNIVVVPAPPPPPGGGGTTSKVPTTTFPPRGGNSEYMVRAEPVTTKPEESQLSLLRVRPGVAPGGGDTALGGLSLMTSKGPVPITLGTGTPGFDLRSELIPGLDTLFRFPEGPRDAIPTDIEVRLPEGAPLGSLHVFDVGLRTERGDLAGSGLRVMILVTE
ncbi:hypothetical protein [Streptomyces gardneri]|uniref:CARDB domain-containing protein n=1 Tax=Streptomyces gardneri TaxID=66892 RepID=A0A4Y3RW39_9ACTN|nr:hypothetical protein [Streptomyces gardneri]GEB61288.1 hypothetical protein SGA01_68930 [Streptomyces gardneri]GHH22224.1 hypothetical protein GCM10017674_77820 [Streptomyces gardneri]